MPNLTISKTFTFEASHILPNHSGKCARLHGHSWVLVVSVKGAIDKKTGFVADFYDISQVVKEHVVDKLDHTHLGCGVAMTPGMKITPIPYLGESFYPTSENLCIAIAHILKTFIKELSPHVRLYSIEVRETCTSAARWCADDEPTLDDRPTFPGVDYPHIA